MAKIKYYLNRQFFWYFYFYTVRMIILWSDSCAASDLERKISPLKLFGLIHHVKN